MARGSKRVRVFLEDQGINVEVRNLDKSTKTFRMAADAVGCTVPEIAKSIVFTRCDESVVVVVSGDKPLKFLCLIPHTNK